MYLQQLLLVGRATKDGKVHNSKKGKKFGTFSLAVNRYIEKADNKKGSSKEEKKEETTFYEIVSFGKKGEAVSERIRKGELIVVTGRPAAEAYLSKDGEAKAQLKVVARDWYVIK
ncbi:single-stranded DNA-binding protein [Candidatus Dojkabacteria bacterium]|nr:single-stranded DNA-binding protein [Candidatus Dojkabacteria bacterium]